MTDYIERDVIQESEVEEPISEQQIMESFMALQVSFAQLECMCEYQTIIEYCGTEIPHPTLYQEGDFGDAVSAFFDNIGDWLSGIIRSIMNIGNRNGLARIIKAIDDSNKKDFRFKAELFTTYGMLEWILMAIDELAKVLNDIKDGAFDENDKIKETDMETLEVLSKIRSAGDADKLQSAVSGKDKRAAVEIVSQEMKRIRNKDELLDELKKIHDLNLPVTGRKLLKRIKFDKKETKKGDKMDKDLSRLIRRCANSIAKMYDIYIFKFVTALNDFCNDNEIKYSVDVYKASSDNKWKSRTFRDQTDPVGSLTSKMREASTK